MIRTFRKRPVEVRAVQFTGTNHTAVQVLTGTSEFDAIAPEDRVDDPDKTAQVYDKLHSVWVPVEPGDWIIQGIRGEFYPCEETVFAATYEQVEQP